MDVRSSDKGRLHRCIIQESTKRMTEINVRHEFENVWSYLHCPECTEPIAEPKQIRCHKCKVLFDWEDEE